MFVAFIHYKNYICCYRQEIVANFCVSVQASTISMSQVPPGAVSENTVVSFMCVTDEARPTADVLWKVRGNNKSLQSIKTVVPGQYNTQKRISELPVRADRRLNGEKVECYVRGQPAIKEESALDCICEFIKSKLCQLKKTISFEH